MPEYEDRMKELEIVNDFDLYSLRDSVAHFLAPRLRLMQNTPSYPPDLTLGEWQTLLRKMADAFEIVAEWDDLELDPQMLEEKITKIREGLQLFSLWFMDLWT